jgi:hypothetical protein
MIVLYFKASRLALGSTQSRIYWIPEALSWEICGWCCLIKHWDKFTVQIFRNDNKKTKLDSRGN